MTHLQEIHYIIDRYGLEGFKNSQIQIFKKKWIDKDNFGIE